MVLLNKIQLSFVKYKDIGEILEKGSKYLLCGAAIQRVHL